MEKPPWKEGRIEMKSPTLSLNGLLHSRRSCKLGLLGCLILALASVSCSKKEAPKAELAYPAPRFPRYLVHPNDGELLRAARVAVRQSVGRSPLGKMQSGQAVYVFAHGGMEMKVWDALKQAWSEKGVEAHLMMPWEVMGISKEQFEQGTKELPRGNEGWKEVAFFRGEYLKFFPEDLQKQFGKAYNDADLRRKDIPRYLDRHPEVKYFFAGEGGGSGWILPYDKKIIDKHGDKFMGNFIFYRSNDLLSKAAEFPTDVWNLVEEKILRPRSFVSEIDFQDPEGTKLHWLLTPEQAQYWTARSPGGGDEASNHIYIYPNPLHSTLADGAVIVAHANHTGEYPTMKAFLDRYGQIQRLEGGGKFAEMFRILLEHPKFKEAQFPKAPEPGYWFMRQDGFATNPKFVENFQMLIEGGYYLPNLNERNRAGVQHLAFSYSSDDPEDYAYADKREIPAGGSHTAHMHVYFPTIKWKLRDTGEWISIADKGYVKVFDDPEVRALASRYGNPDQIFRYEWIPELPGINVPGNYEKDFAPDPWAYMMAMWKRIQDGTYAYFIDDYAPENKQVAQNTSRP
jgi:hypothetical protein